MWSTMKIGQLAKAVQCHVETVRYYEKQGLLPPAKKLSNGYGEYSNDHLQVLRLIRHAKSLGFSQSQIRQLVQLASERTEVCRDVYQVTQEQLKVVDDKLSELSKIKESLVRLSEACKNNRDNSCPILKELAFD